MASVRVSSQLMEDDLLMHPVAYIAAAAALFLIGFFGFFLNLLVIILMCKDKKLWTPLNVILFNLVCSDFAVSILGNPFTLASAVARNWIFGPTMCVIYGFFMSLLGITSITTLTVLSFERFLMVSRPLFNQQNLNRKSATYIVVAIWVYSLALTMPPLFGWGEYVHEAADISCSVNWESRTYANTTYILFLFALGLVVPMIVISYSYLNIIRTMRTQSRLQIGRVNKAEGRVTLMVALMIGAFLVSWLPYAVLALLIQFGDSNLVTPGLAVIPALVAKSSICYNPIIYVGLNTQFRASCRHLIGGEVHSEANNERSRKMRSKMKSQSSQDETIERSRLMCSSSVANEWCQGMTPTKNSQVLQLFPMTTNPHNAPKMLSTMRKLSTVVQENDSVEVKLVTIDSEVAVNCDCECDAV